MGGIHLFDFDEGFIKMFDLKFTNADDNEMNTNKIKYKKRIGELLGKNSQDAKLKQENVISAVILVVAFVIHIPWLHFALKTLQ